MAERPRRATTYNGHPGQIMNNAKQVRQSKKEVEAEKAEKAEKKAVAAAKVKEAEQRWEVGIQRVAAIENKIQKKINNARENAMRPDKVNQDFHQEHLMQENETQNLLSHPDEATQDEMELRIDDVGTDTYEPTDLPPMSMVGTSESEPEMYGAGDEESGDDGGNDEYIPKEGDEEVNAEDNEEDIEAEFQSFMERRNAEKLKEKADKAKKKEKVSFRHYNQSTL